MKYSKSEFERICATSHLPKLPVEVVSLLKSLLLEIQSITPKKEFLSISRGIFPNGNPDSTTSDLTLGGISIKHMTPEQKRICSSSMGLRRDKSSSAMNRMNARLKGEQERLQTVRDASVVETETSNASAASTIVFRFGTFCSSDQDSASGRGPPNKFTNTNTSNAFVSQTMGDSVIVSLQSIINKLTESNYEEMLHKCKELFIPIFEDVNADEAYLETISENLFVLTSMNGLKVYADFYTDMLSCFPVLYAVFHESTKRSLQRLSTIRYVNPDVDYDGFCESNKENESLRKVVLFFKHLFTNKILAEDNYIQLCNTIMLLMITNLQAENRKDLTEEYAELLSIVYIQEVLRKSTELFLEKSFHACIRFLANSKKSAFPSLSSKTIFKCMDMMEH